VSELLSEAMGVPRAAETPKPDTLSDLTVTRTRIYVNLRVFLSLTRIAQSRHGVI
jgi:hypothetical protein